MPEAEPSQEQVHEVDITYSTEELVEKLQQHKLQPLIAYSKVIIDKRKLILLQKELSEDSHLFQLCELVNNWQSKNDASLFTTNVNQLIFVWINAIESDEHTQVILGILRCFQIKPGASFSRSSRFHLFLNSLVIETMQKYHLATLDYMLNYDEDLLLPNTSQIVPNLETTLTQSNDNQITALLSLHFQTENNNFLLPKDMSINLNKQLMNIIKKM